MREIIENVVTDQKEIETIYNKWSYMMNENKEFQEQDECESMGDFE